MGFEEDAGVHLVFGKELVLGGAGAVAGMNRDEALVPRLVDGDAGVGRDALNQAGLRPGKEDKLLQPQRDIDQLLLYLAAG